MARAIRAGHHRWLAAMAAGLFAVCLVALTPHLVHHLRHDSDQGPSCAFLAMAEHTPSFSAIVLEMPEPEDVGRLELPARVTTRRAEPIAVAPARAPPSASRAA